MTNPEKNTFFFNCPAFHYPGVTNECFFSSVMVFKMGLYSSWPEAPSFWASQELLWMELAHLSGCLTLPQP